MKPVLILYATRQGHTHRIAEYMVARLMAQGVSSDMVDAAHVSGQTSFDRYSAAFICSSVHMGKHESEIAALVKHHRKELENLPTAFLSVSLSEAAVENPTADPARREQAKADVERMINEFLKETGWRPKKIKAVGGALQFTKYNFVLRFIMQRISEKAGGDTDTSHDYEYTDWDAVDSFVDQVIKGVDDGVGVSA